MTQLLPTAIVGDIHGDVELLRLLLADSALSSRALVFLGDYVNRGPSSKEVIDLLINLRATHDRPTTFLRGNHDEALLDVLQGGSVTRLLLMGGSATVRSWVPEVVGDVGQALRDSTTQSQREFLEKLEDEWVGDDVRATHDRSFDRSGPGGPGLHVVGHYIQRDRIPKIVDGVAYLDTGCGSIPGGRLSALLLPERQFVVR